MTTHIRQNLPLRKSFTCPHCNTEYDIVIQLEPDDLLAIRVMETAEEE